MNEVIKVRRNEEGKILIKLFGTVYEIQIIEDVEEEEEKPKQRKK